MAFTVTDGYHNNLDALSVLDSATALLIDAVEVPDSVEACTGRDGSATFRIEGVSQQRQWFGGSSMPTVSAVELLCGFQSDGRNTVLTGIFTGYEAIVLLDKMPPHAALFVVEPNPLYLKLAMCLWDYVSYFESGRLVFVAATSQTMGDRFVEFFEREPGYAWPTHVQVLALVPPARRLALQHELALAGERVAALQIRAVDTLKSALSRVSEASPDDTPRVIVCCHDPRPEVWETVRAMDRALANLDWPHRCSVPNSPRGCHIASVLGTLHEHRADIVLFVNGGADSIASLLPKRVSVGEWYLPNTVWTALARAAATSSVIKLASTERARRHLTDQSSRSANVTLCEVAGDDTVFAPAVSGAPGSGKRLDIVLLADLPDDRPESSGINLISQLNLWRSAQALVRTQADRFTEARVDELLACASRESGTTLEESVVRTQFLNLFRARIIPANQARAVVDTIQRLRLRMEVLGRGWSFGESGGRASAAPIPSPEDRSALYQRTRLVVLPSASTDVMQEVMNVLLCGTPIICRGSQEALVSDQPGLSDLSGYVSYFEKTSQLPGLVSNLLADFDRAQEMASNARELILEKHTFGRRLHHIVRVLRRRKAAPANAVGLPS